MSNLNSKSPHLWCLVSAVYSSNNPLTVPKYRIKFIRTLMEGGNELFNKTHIFFRFPCHYQNSISPFNSSNKNLKTTTIFASRTSFWPPARMFCLPHVFYTFNLRRRILFICKACRPISSRIFLPL